MMRTALIVATIVFAWLAPARAEAIGCILLGCDCSVTASDIAFEPFSPLLAGPQTAIGEIEIVCTGLLSIGAGVTVEMLGGQWGVVSARKMRSGSGTLMAYNLYKTGAHNSVWGAGAQAMNVNGGLLVLGAWTARRDVFARLDADPTLAPGDYTDTVVVRVIW